MTDNIEPDHSGEEKSAPREIIRPIEQEMKKSYIDYAMSVIVGRALPDVRDGLKPVHRRILYGMHDLGMASNKPHKKSARVVGEILGKYHPHGDSSVYDALVRMAQSFSLRYPMVDGHGNFGSVDGDSAAAMRYTECRLEKAAEDILRDIDKDTVSWVDNFDSSLKEPEVLPSMMPNLLVNGSSGIAVGMATNIPPHNMREVCDALLHLIDHPSADTIDLMGFIPGPDFPTGGIIYGTNGIVEAYSTGRGRLKVRGRTSIEDHDGKKRIIVSEIPYQVNKSKLVESIADLVKEKRIEGITDLRDESDREGMRVVIELRKDVMEEIILNQLFQHTQLEVTFGVINLALVDNQPKVLTLQEMLQAYLDYRVSVVTKRTEYDLRKAEERHHILVGLIRAVDAIDDAIRIIRGAANSEEARLGLMERFQLDDVQAKAILEMRLRALTGLEIEELRKEYAQLEETIRGLQEILADIGKIMAIIKGELLEMRERYGDDRKTEILIDNGELDIEDLIPNEQMVVMISSDGYIKRLPLDTYKQQHRGGQGLLGMETKEEERVVDLFVTMTHNVLLFFTDRGRVYQLKVPHPGGRAAFQGPAHCEPPSPAGGGRETGGQHIDLQLRRRPRPGVRHPAWHHQAHAAEGVPQHPRQRDHRHQSGGRRRAGGDQSGKAGLGDRAGLPQRAGRSVRRVRGSVGRPRLHRCQGHAPGRGRRGGEHGGGDPGGQAPQHHRERLRENIARIRLP